MDCFLSSREYLGVFLVVLLEGALRLVHRVAPWKRLGVCVLFPDSFDQSDPLPKKDECRTGGFADW